MELTTIGRAVFDLFFPRRCLNCDSVISTAVPLCVSCSAELPFTHWDLDNENFAFQKLNELCNLKAAYSLLFFRHDNVTQQLLHYLKYYNHQSIGIILGQKVLQTQNLNSFDGIIPIPIHPKKLKNRGYNQVMPFAQTLSQENKIPIINNFLIRVENNPSQVFKNREKRMNSIQNAFDLNPQNLKGHFLLVDDVLTTGATLSTCVNLIHEKQPELQISCLTMACAQ